jgi:hypothetical protein
MRPSALVLVAALLVAGPLEAQMHQQGQAQPRGTMGQTGMTAHGTGSMPMMGPTDMGMMGMGGMEMMGPMAELSGFAPAQLLAHREQLELADDQIAKLSALQEKAEAAATQAHEPAHAAMTGLKNELTSQSPDMDAVRRLFEAHQTAMGNVQWAHAEAALEARKLLSPEQVGIVKGMRMRDGMGMPRGPQGGMR